MFNNALEASDYTRVRGNYAGHQLLCLCPNTPVFVAQINQTSFPDDGFAALTYDSVTTGAYTDLVDGMTLLVSTSSDPRDAYFTGRVRGSGHTSSTIDINETAMDFSDNDYIIVLEDYRLHAREARPNGSGGQYKDYALTYAGLNPVITGLTVNGLPGLVGAGVCDPDTDILTLAFSASAIAAESGASISSYAYTVTDGMTVSAGDADTADVTIAFDPGWYWLALTVTDSGARTTTLRIPVVAVPADYSSVAALGFTGAQVDGDVDSGYSVSVNAFDGIDDVLDNTACILFEVNDSGGNVAGNVKFYGRLRTESSDSQPDELASRILETRFTLEDTSAQLARLNTQPITLEIDSNANAFDEVVNLTYWRAACYLLQWHSTFFSLYTLAFSDTSNDSLFLNWGIGGADFLTELNSIADDWAAAFEAAPDGRCQIAQRGTVLEDTGRDALTTVASLTAQDAIAFSLAREHVPTVGVVNAGGGVYHTSSGDVNEYLSKAPGIVRGVGAGEHTVPGQVLPVNSSKAQAEAELNRRAGHVLAEENPTDELTVTFPDGYDFFIPSRAQWVTWTLSEDDLTLRGISYDTSVRWWVRGVSYGHSNDTGTKEVSVVFRRETRGQPGETQPLPTPAEIDFILPPIPAPAYPNFPPLPDLIFGDEPGAGDVPPYYDPTPGVDTVPVDGNAQLWWSAAHVWATQNALLRSAPNCNDITPDLPVGWTIRDAGPRMMGQIRDFYVLASDGSSSRVYHTENPFAGAVVWDEGEELTGQYDTLEVTSTAGGLWVSAQENSVTDIAFTGAYTELQNNGNPVTVTPVAPNRVRITWTYTVPSTSSPTFRLILQPVALEANDQTFTTIKVRISPRNTGSINRAFPNIGSCNASDPDDQGFPLLTLMNATGAAEVNPSAVDVQTNHIDYTFNNGGTPREPIGFEVDAIGCRQGANSGAFHSATFDLEIIELDGTPVTTSLQVAYSSDYGATFGTPDEIGSAPDGFVGLAATKIGDLLLVGYDGQVAETDSAANTADYGDPVPDEGQPNALYIPRFQFGTTSTNNATSTPEYLLASSTVTSNDEALWKVTDAGTTFTDITPDNSGTEGYAVSSHCLAMPWGSGSVIAAVLQFGSLPYVAFSDDAGSNWTLRGPLDAAAAMVTFRKGDLTFQQLFGGGGRPFYSPNRGATIVYKTYPEDPQDDPLLGVAVYG